MTGPLALAALFAFAVPVRAVEVREPQTIEELKEKADIETLVASIAALSNRQSALRSKATDLTAVWPLDSKNRLERIKKLRLLQAEFQNNQVEIAKKAEDAIGRTAALYGIDPGGQPDKDGVPRPPWDIKFDNRLRHPIWNQARGAWEYQEAQMAPGVTHDGMTWADAKVTITEGAFKFGLVYLAATMIHERVHHDQEALGYGKQMSSFQREWAARNAVLNNDTLLAIGASQDDVRRLTMKADAYLATPGIYLPVNIAGGPPSPSADESNDFVIDAEAIARLRGDADALRRSVETGAAERINQSAGRIRDSMTHRSKALIEAEAARCGLTMDAADGSFHFGSQRDKVVLRFQDLDGLRVALMLARACGFPGLPTACNEGMGPFQSRWGTPAFRDEVTFGAGTSEELGRCFFYLRDNLKPSIDFGDVRRGVEKFYAERRRQDGQAQPPDRRQNPPRGGRGGSEPPPPDSDIPWCLRAPGRRCIH